jgi:pimeloyl-ACP methyl ester carboxylesterase
MPDLTTSDGVRLHWYATGEGPPVVIPPYVLGMPGSVQPFVDEVSRDHTVVAFDARGTGQSQRVGPHDMETGTADLEAVIEEACDEPAVIVAMADACNRAVRVAARRPDLVAAVITPGAAPLNRVALRDVDAMAGSDSVVGALFETLEGYYASGIRTILTSANAQLSEDEVRTRVETLVDYLPQEVAVGRLRDWIDDDPEDPARSLGDKLIVLTSDNVVRPWWPSEGELVGLMRDRLPEARIEHVDDGVVSRPDQAAAILRAVTGRLREPAVER